MLKYLTIIFFLFGGPIRAEETPEETFNALARTITSVSSGEEIQDSGTCLPENKLYEAARTNMASLESIIFNAMQHPSRTKEFIGPYLRLWILGKLGQDFFDLMIPNPGIEETYEIDRGMYFSGIYTKKENGRIYWIPLLLDTNARNITILTWEQCRGKCYSTESAASSAFGICGKWSWDKDTKQVTSFCSCNNRNDCGAKNTYIIQAANLILLQSLRKKKCDGKPFIDHAKPCCMR